MCEQPKQKPVENIENIIPLQHFKNRTPTPMSCLLRNWFVDWKNILGVDKKTEPEGSIYAQAYQCCSWHDTFMTVTQWQNITFILLNSSKYTAIINFDKGVGAPVEMQVFLQLTWNSTSAVPLYILNRRPAL